MSLCNSCEHTFNNSVIETVPSLKILGVFFSECMSWNCHTSSVTPKLARVTGMLYQHHTILPVRVKILPHNVFFSPHITYAHLVWGNTMTSNG